MSKLKLCWQPSYNQFSKTMRGIESHVGSTKITVGVTPAFKDSKRPYTWQAWSDEGSMICRGVQYKTEKKAKKAAYRWVKYQLWEEKMHQRYKEK